MSWLSDATLCCPWTIVSMPCSPAFRISAGLVFTAAYSDEPLRRHRFEPNGEWISRLEDVSGDKPKRQKFKRYPIGFFHVDIAEVQTAEGKLYLFVGIDRTSKFAVTQLVDKADRKTAWEFLEHLLKSVPYRIHTILTDNGIQFADQPRNRNQIYSRPMRFDMICDAHGVEHRLTRPNHPWTNGQVERMNRTIKDGEADQKTIRGIVFLRNVKRFHYQDHQQLRAHLGDYMAAYNYARRLKTLNGLTPYE